MITIEKNIPVAEPAKNKYPFGRLMVNDSFFIPEPPNVMSVRVAAYQFGGRHHMKFVTRLVTENKISGLRVWRIK